MVFGWLTAWWVKLAVVATLVAGLLWVKHTYDASVTEAAVAAAIAGEVAKSEPIIRGLANTLAERDATIADIKTKSEAERIRQVALVELKSKELKNALHQNRTFKADLDKLRSSDFEFQRVLDTIAANNNSTSGTSASARLVKLGAAHTQCERDYRTERAEHSETIERLGEALSVVKALKQ